jgi:hypothetical protein
MDNREEPRAPFRSRRILALILADCLQGCLSDCSASNLYLLLARTPAPTTDPSTFNAVSLLSIRVAVYRMSGSNSTQCFRESHQSVAIRITHPGENLGKRVARAEISLNGCVGNTAVDGSHDCSSDNLRSPVCVDLSGIALRLLRRARGACFNEHLPILTRIYPSMNPGIPQFPLSAGAAVFATTWRRLRGQADWRSTESHPHGSDLVSEVCCQAAYNRDARFDGRFFGGAGGGEQSEPDSAHGHAGGLRDRRGPDSLVEKCAGGRVQELL